MEQNLYFIISCAKPFAQNIQKNISIEHEKIKIKPLEIIDNIKNKDIFKDIKELSDSLNNKNIYLYKLKLIPTKDNDNNNITIIIDNLNMNEYKLKCSLNLKKGVKNYFIYSTEFKYDFNFNFKNIAKKIGYYLKITDKFIDKDSEDFINKKFDIENYQKFLLFKSYLKQKEKSNYIDDLLNCTIQEIYNINSYEFILIFLIDLIKFEKDYLKINHKLFESFISEFNMEKNIDIKQYKNEEYYKIIAIIEDYRVFLEQKPKLLLNLDIIILLFYQKNIRKEFNIFFNKIKSKNEVVHYILKNREIFYAYDCDEMEIIYKNGAIKIYDVLNLCSNFNEYIKFYIKMYENKNKRIEILKVDLAKMPNIQENYEFNYLIKFVDITIDDNDIKYYPYEKYVELINKLNNYKKLLELKSIFLDKYNKNWKSDDINKNLRKKIHEIGKLDIEADNLDNMQIIKFIQDDAKFYYNDYANIKNDEYACLIGHINLNEINEDFKNQFYYNNYDYEKLMKENYPKFIKSIFKKVESFNNLQTLYELFNLQYKQNIKKNDVILNKIIDIIFDKQLKRNNKDFSKEIKDLIIILFKYVNKNETYLNYLFNGIKDNLSQDEIDEIYMKILNNYFDNFNKNIIDKLIYETTNEGLSTISVVLKKYNSNKKLQKYYLSKKNLKVINEEEIFDNEFSCNLKLILNLVESGFFLDNYFEDINYIKQTKTLLNNQKSNLKSLNFKINLLHRLKSLKNGLKKRIFIISFGHKEESDELFQLINSKIKSYLNICNKLDRIIELFSNYYPNEKNDIILEYGKLIENITQNPIKEFPENINNLDDNYKIALNYII